MKRSIILALWLSFICLGSFQLHAQEYHIYNPHYGGYWVMDQNGSGRISLSDRIPGAEGIFTIVDVGGGQWAIKAKGEKFLRLDNAGVKADARITNRSIFSSVGNENAQLFRSENLRFLFINSNRRLAHQAWSNEGAFVFRLTGVNAIAGPEYREDYEDDVYEPAEPSTDDLMRRALDDFNARIKQINELVVPPGIYAMKPPLSTNSWVSHGGVSIPKYYAKKDRIDSWEKIEFINTGEKDVYFLKSADGKYLSSKPSGTVVKTSQPQKWEKWGILKEGDYFAIYSKAHSRFLSANKNREGLLETSPTFDKWEKWTLQKL